MHNRQNAYTFETYLICLLYNWSTVWIGRIVFYAFYKSHTDEQSVVVNNASEKSTYRTLRTRSIQIHLLTHLGRSNEVIARRFRVGSGELCTCSGRGADFRSSNLHKEQFRMKTTLSLVRSRDVIAIELPSTANTPHGRDGDSSVAATEGRSVDDRQA
jgi:hypothetical protein